MLHVGAHRVVEVSCSVCWIPMTQRVIATARYHQGHQSLGKSLFTHVPSLSPLCRFPTKQNGVQQMHTVLRMFRLFRPIPWPPHAPSLSPCYAFSPTKRDPVRQYCTCFVCFVCIIGDRQLLRASQPADSDRGAEDRDPNLRHCRGRAHRSGVLR